MSASNRSTPVTRSFSGLPSQREAQTTGMPSTFTRAQLLMIWRSAGSRWAFTSLSTFTTTCWWGRPLRTKPSTRCSVSCIVRLSIWQPIIWTRGVFMASPRPACCTCATEACGRRQIHGRCRWLRSVCARPGIGANARGCGAMYCSGAHALCGAGGFTPADSTRNRHRPCPRPCPRAAFELPARCAARACVHWPCCCRGAHRVSRRRPCRQRCRAASRRWLRSLPSVHASPNRARLGCAEKRRAGPPRGGPQAAVRPPPGCRMARTPGPFGPCRPLWHLS